MLNHVLFISPNILSKLLFSREKGNTDWGYPFDNLRVWGLCRLAVEIFMFVARSRRDFGKFSILSEGKQAFFWRELVIGA